MFALVALRRIRTSTSWNPTNSDLINIARRTSNIELLLWTFSILTDDFLSIDQEHPLRSHALQAFHIRDWSFGSESLETLLFWFLAFTLGLLLALTLGF